MGRPQEAAAAEVVAPAGSPAPEQVPVVHFGGPRSDAEVVMHDPDGPRARPRRTVPTRKVLAEATATGVLAAVFVVTMIVGFYIGRSLNRPVAETIDATIGAPPPAAEPRRDLDLAWTPPPRGGAERKPDAAGSRARSTDRGGVDRATQAAGRSNFALHSSGPVAGPPALIAVEENGLWLRLTALMREGIRLHREGWYGPAIARFREAVALMPDYPRAYLWLGRSGLKAGRLDEARRALLQVIALDPQGTAAHEADTLLSQIDRDN